MDEKALDNTQSLWKSYPVKVLVQEIEKNNMP